MNCQKIANKIQSKYFINFFLLIGFILAVTRLEKFFNESEDFSYYPVLEYNELVINELSSDEHNLKHYYDKNESKSYNVENTKNTYSYKLSILGHNSLLNNKFITVKLNHISHRNIISILQKNNIWHKSSEEEPINFS